jgi:hypothetical protein
MWVQKRKAGFTPGLRAFKNIFPGDDEFGLPFPPYLVSGVPQPRIREYGDAALFLTSISKKEKDK